MTLVVAMAALLTAPSLAQSVDDTTAVPPAPEGPLAPPPWPDESALRSPVRVLLEIHVSVDGAITEARSLESSAPEAERPLFDAAAEAYALGLRLRPALRSGQPTAARIRLEVVFTPPVDAAVDAAAPSEPTPQEPTESEPSDTPDAAGPDTPPAVDPGLGVESPDDPDAFGAVAEVEADDEALVSATDRDIEVGALGRVPRRDAQAMLTLAPGIMLSNHGGEGHAAAMFLRGFDAAEGEDLEVLADGIPLNDVSNAHGHGYADTSFVIPELISAVRVVQGPFDPAQGDFAVAGSAEYRLGLAERGVHGLLSYGSYGDRRLALLWGPSGQPEGTFVGVSLRDGDGFGSNRAYGNVSSMAQVEVALSDTWTVRSLAFGSSANWRQAGPLRLDDVQAGELPCGAGEFAQFFCTYDSSQGGSASRGGGGVTLTWHEGPTRARVLVHAGRHTLRVRENFTGFAGDPRTDGGPQRGDALDQRYQATTFGLRAELQHRFALLDRVQRVELGVVLRRDDTRAVQDRLRAELRVPYRSDFDRDIDVTGVGAYARLDADLLAWLAISAGLRADAYGFEVLDRNRPDVDRIGERLPREATSAFGFTLQPRATLRVRLLPQHPRVTLDWVTSVGKGARSSDAAALSEGELAPFARVLATETGLVAELAHDEERAVRLEAGSSLFATRVESDLVFDATRGRNTPAGPSTRTGWMAFARLRVGEWLDVSASATWTRGHLSPPSARTADLFAGPRLPFIPEWVARLDAVGQHSVRVRRETFTGSLALGAQYVGERPLPLGQTSVPWLVLDTALALRWRWLELGVTIENLLDARYRQAEFNYVSNFEPDRAPSLMAARHFVAGPPRRVTAMLGAHVPLGGAP